MNDQDIKDRIQGRRDAAEVLSLITSDSREWKLSFWKAIADAAKIELAALGVIEETPRPKIVPMDDREARIFENQMFPPQFKKHAGEPVWQVADNDPGYLDFLCESVESGFVPDLRRWMART